MKWTTISLKPETKERIQKKGHKGQSYDTILNSLIDLVDNKLE